MAASPYQQRRLDYARRIMDQYASFEGVDMDRHCNFIDLFADLLHLAHAEGEDGEDLFRVASGHWRAELLEQGGDA